MMIEIIASILVLTIGVLSLMSVFNNSRTLSTVAQRQAVLAQAAEQEIEKIDALPYSSVALSSNPSCVANGGTNNNPTVANLGGCPSGPFTYTYDGTQAHAENVLVSTGTGQVPPSFTQTVPGPSGGNPLTLTLYVYVTAATDSACSGCTKGSSSENFKRVTVSVVSNPALDKSDTPVTASTFIADPCAEPSGATLSCTVQ